MIIYESSLNDSSFEEVESTVKIPSIPVIENIDLGQYVVSFTDIDSLAEDYGCDYEDAVYAIAEENNLDPNSLAVSVEDWKLIETPELVDLVPNIVVKPISENNIVYQITEQCLNEYEATGDEYYLTNIDEISSEFVGRVFKNYRNAYNARNKYNSAKNAVSYAEKNDSNNKERIEKTHNKLTKASDEFFKKRDFGFRKEHSSQIQNYHDLDKRISELRAKNNKLNKKHGWDKYKPNPQNWGDGGNGKEYNKNRYGDYYVRDNGKSKLTNFVAKHKKAAKIGVGLGAGAGMLWGGYTVAKNIAALRRLQKAKPTLASRIENMINKLKKKLHRK